MARVRKILHGFSLGKLQGERKMKKGIRLLENLEASYDNQLKTLASRYRNAVLAMWCAVDHLIMTSKSFQRLSSIAVHIFYVRSVLRIQKWLSFLETLRSKVFSTKLES